MLNNVLTQKLQCNVCASWHTVLKTINVYCTYIIAAMALLLALMVPGIYAIARWEVILVYISNNWRFWTNCSQALKSKAHASHRRFNPRIYNRPCFQTALAIDTFTSLTDSQISQYNMLASTCMGRPNKFSHSKFRVNKSSMNAVEIDSEIIHMEDEKNVCQEKCLRNPNWLLKKKGFSAHNVAVHIHFQIFSFGYFQFLLVSSF